jgi:tetratricopeptide (TPR) repeat protein
MVKNRNGELAAPPNANARLAIDPEDKAKAKKWFDRARELGEKRQFDYAVEYYVNGLEFWPDAVEEALKALHGCAVARRQLGGKRPGLKDTMRRSTNDKDPKRGFLSSLWLFGHDPDHVGYIEGVARNASRLRAEDAAKWAGGVLLRALDSAPKVNIKQLQTLALLFEELGDRAAERNEAPFAESVYQMGVDTLNVWRRRLASKDDKVEQAVKNLSTKLTILKGKYEESESYRDSIRDLDEQVDLHDQQRSVQSDDRVDDLVAKAEAAYKHEPESAETLKSLVDLLCRRERDEDETRAIRLLLDEYKRSDTYRWKHLADDIYMKQLGRKTRQLVKQGDEEALKKHRVAQLRSELGVFKERTDRYPTDNRVRFEYAVRNFRAGRFDEAIPLFQGARVDPKNRAACGMYLGRCFFRKGYHSQAIAALQESLGEHEFSDDDLAKTMLYWLGRSQEIVGDAEAARKTYGRILQMDYNYSDVRGRLDALKPAG